MDSSAFVGAAAPLRVAAPARATICMAADDKPVVSRRAALTGAAAAALAAVAGSLPALAEREYANVPFLGGSDIIDINNANVRAYAKYPGMYPTVAGIIATNGPFESVSDLFKIPGLTDLQIATLKKYQDKLVALTPTPEYVRFWGELFVSCCVALPVPCGSCASVRLAFGCVVFSHCDRVLTRACASGLLPYFLVLYACLPWARFLVLSDSCLLASSHDCRSWTRSTTASTVKRAGSCFFSWSFPRPHVRVP